MPRDRRAAQLATEREVTGVQGARRIDDDHGPVGDVRPQRRPDVEAVFHGPRPRRGAGADRQGDRRHHQMDDDEEPASTTSRRRRHPPAPPGPESSNTVPRIRAMSPKAPTPANVSNRSIGNVAQTGTTENSRPVAQKRARRSRRSSGAMPHRNRASTATANHHRMTRPEGRNRKARSEGGRPNWPSRRTGAWSIAARANRPGSASGST